MQAFLFIIDDFFPDFAEARAMALSHDFTQEPEFDGHKYPGFAPIKEQAFIDYVAQLLATGINATAVDIKLACFVSAQEGFSTPQWIHTDNPIAKFAAVCHLHDRRGKGTQFWRHNVFGDALIQVLDNPLDVKQLQAQGAEPDRCPNTWTKTDYADSKPNRLYFYPANRFHSRWPKQGIGSTPDDSRLTMIFFFDVH